MSEREFFFTQFDHTENRVGIGMPSSESGNRRLRVSTKKKSAVGQCNHDHEYMSRKSHN